MISKGTIAKGFMACGRAGLKGGPTPDLDQEGVVKTWQLVLQNLSDKQFEAAVIYQVRCSEWWPTPSAIFDNLEAMADQPFWEDGWQEMLKHGNTFNPPAFHGSVDYTQACEAGLRAVGGWSYFCQSPVSATPVNRAAFREGYKACAGKQRQRARAMGVAPELSSQELQKIGLEA